MPDQPNQSGARVRSPRRGSGGALRWALPELGALGVLTIAALSTGGLAPGVRIGVVAGAGLVGAGVVVRRAMGRRGSLERLEDRAARLGADASLGGPGGASGASPDHQDLSRAMDEAGTRVRSTMRESAKRTRNLEALIDAIDEPILATDSAERVLHCNRSAERLLETPAGGLIGRDIRELFTQATILELHQSARGGQTRRERVRVVTSLGARTFQVTASPVPVAWGEGVFGAVLALRDVTELATSVQIQTDFVANASHELRTPVAAIRGAAETLQAAADDPVMGERLRAMILSNAVRLEEMLRDLLDLSRLDSPSVALDLGPIELERMLDDVRAMSEYYCAQRGLSLAFEIDPRLRHLRSDRKLLLLILRNLIENATKFAHEGSTIRVVGTVLDDRPGATNEPAPIRLSVIDRGVGIPLSAQERVFERYYQADPARTAQFKGYRRGTGLGLAIVKHAAQALGGKAALSSVWGQGTTVWVEFPAELLEGAPSPPSAGVG